ncbi:hypothetical protein BP00DRAFT_33906 [Aspergillus indologenus CBS 114.80]|uniref:Uncharacterized protein n=1 Tax=Aspergillus indologenus CBS 114.80 TaxID=1450541 RepID=A0A2V5HRN2_9EURO|nr:hypothetical protein BP00DRAFT_33906 [Aspergillus indologenus CBS 114.80]
MKHNIIATAKQTNLTRCMSVNWRKDTNKSGGALRQNGGRRESSLPHSEAETVSRDHTSNIGPFALNLLRFVWPWLKPAASELIEHPCHFFAYPRSRLRVAPQVVTRARAVPLLLFQWTQLSATMRATAGTSLRNQHTPSSIDLPISQSIRLSFCIRH